MKESVSIHEDEVEGDYGYGDGLRVTCDKCGHYIEVMGTSDRSAELAAHMMRNECPTGENNCYDVDWWQN